MPGDVPESDSRRYVRTTRLEAFSDGVFAIAITLLVLDLAIGQSGSALHRVLEGWPFYLAYLVSFLTIGAAWLGHNAITDRLTKADAGLLRLNLVVLLQSRCFRSRPDSWPKESTTPRTSDCSWPCTGLRC